MAPHMLAGIIGGMSNYLWFVKWKGFLKKKDAFHWEHMPILLGTETSIIKHVIFRRDDTEMGWHEPMREHTEKRPCCSPRLLKSQRLTITTGVWTFTILRVMLPLILKCKCILTHVESLFILKLPVQRGTWCSLVKRKCLDITNGESWRPSLMYLNKRICPHWIRLVNIAALN